MSVQAGIEAPVRCRSIITPGPAHIQPPGSRSFSPPRCRDLGTHRVAAPSRQYAWRLSPQAKLSRKVRPCILCDGTENASLRRLMCLAHMMRL